MLDSDFLEQMLVQALKSKDTAQAFVGERIMTYVNTHLTHADCQACVMILEKNVTAIINHPVENVRNAQRAVTIIKNLLYNIKEYF